ncbi:hypothetical protein MMC29_005424 [Sticta canariensis]|nr:hypothetical protein [Sticta canariensis]
MGLQRFNQLWTDGDNVLLLQKPQRIPHVQYLKRVQPFRGNFHYSNWGYALAGEIIESLTRESWDEFVQEKLLQPLQMTRSGVHQDIQDHDFAKGYTALDDRSFYPLPPVQAQDGNIMGSSQGILSNIEDMLKWRQAFVSAMNNQQESDTASSTKSPLRQLPQLITGHPLFRSLSIKLPAPLGATGCNPGFAANMPVVDHGSDEAVLYHQGSLTGYTSSIFLLPNTESANFVMTNSISLNDYADWVCQLILETVVGTTQPNDYQGYAQESSVKHLTKLPLMQKALDEQRVEGTSPKPMKAYIGRYYNAIENFNIMISVKLGNENL